MEVGKLLAFLKEPEPPKGFRDLFDKLPQFASAEYADETVTRRACQQKMRPGDDVDFNASSVMTCWPDDAAPLD